MIHTWYTSISAATKWTPGATCSVVAGQQRAVVSGGQRRRGHLPLRLRVDLERVRLDQATLRLVGRLLAPHQTHVGAAAEPRPVAAALDVRALPRSPAFRRSFTARPCAFTSKNRNVWPQRQASQSLLLAASAGQLRGVKAPKMKSLPATCRHKHTATHNIVESAALNHSRAATHEWRC